MRVPNEDTSPERLVVWARYTHRALTRSAFTDLVAKIEAANDALLAADRRAFDLEMPVAERICDRDHVDSVLDDSARGVRNNLASRFVGAERERPFTDVFPNNIDEYVEATLGNQVEQFGKLCARLANHLPEDDALVTQAIPEIQTAISSWEAAVKEVSAARYDLDAGKSRLAKSVEDWRATMYEVYGLLLGRVGKKKAERYFRPASSRKGRGAKTETPPVSAEPDPTDDYEPDGANED